MTSGKVSHPKPNPEGVHSILETLEPHPHEVAYIGDSIVDEQTARAAGVAFWAYKNSRLAAHHHVTSSKACTHADGPR